MPVSLLESGLRFLPCIAQQIVRLAEPLWYINLIFAELHRVRVLPHFSCCLLHIFKADWLIFMCLYCVALLNIVKWPHDDGQEMDCRCHILLIVIWVLPPLVEELILFVQYILKCHLLEDWCGK